MGQEATEIAIHHERAELAIELVRRFFADVGEALDGAHPDGPSPFERAFAVDLYRRTRRLRADLRRLDVAPLEKCSGEAHRNLHIDHCAECAPRFGYVGPKVIVRGTRGPRAGGGVAMIAMILQVTEAQRDAAAALLRSTLALLFPNVEKVVRGVHVTTTGSVTGWTRCALARDAGGLEVEPGAPSAVRFCVSGALMAATVRTGSMGAAYDVAIWALFYGSILAGRPRETIAKVAGGLGPVPGFPFVEARISRTNDSEVLDEDDLWRWLDAAIVVAENWGPVCPG